MTEADQREAIVTNWMEIRRTPTSEDVRHLLPIEQLAWQPFGKNFPIEQYTIKCPRGELVCGEQTKLQSGLVNSVVN